MGHKCWLGAQLGGDRYRYGACFCDWVAGLIEQRQHIEAIIPAKEICSAE